MEIIIEKWTLIEKRKMECKELNYQTKNVLERLEWRKIMK